MTIVVDDQRKIPILRSLYKIDRPCEVPSWWENILEEGRDGFFTLPIPTAKTENWRGTNILPFFDPKREWELAEPTKTDNHIVPKIQQFFPPDIIWRNGEVKTTVKGTKDGAILTSLVNTIADNRDNLITAVLEELPESKDVFDAISRMSLRNGVVVHIPSRTSIDRNIHILVHSESVHRDTLDNPWLFIHIGDDVQANLVIHYDSAPTTDGDKPLWVNATEVIHVGNNSQVNVLRFAQGNSSTMRFIKSYTSIYADSVFNFNSFHLHNKFLRSEIETYVKGKSTTCSIQGLTINESDNFSETQMTIYHMAPLGTSRIHWRGLGKDRSKTFYRGKIYIAPEAQKTDSIQNFKGLSLSEQAVIDAKPQLEIYADDVRCTHGASVGPPPTELLFYFQSRGISVAQAKRLLVNSFLKQVWATIPFENVEHFIEI